MSGRLLDADPITRKRVDWHTEGDKVVVDSRQDVEPIMLANKRQYNDSDGGFKGDMKHVARIPIAIYEDLMRRGIAKDPAAFKRWLDNPDNRAWRTHPGSLSK